MRFKVWRPVPLKPHCDNYSRRSFYNVQLWRKVFRASAEGIAVDSNGETQSICPSRGEFQTLLLCNGVARYMVLSLKEIMTIKNIRLNILWAISPIVVMLVWWPKSLIIGWHVDHINSPITARRAQWVVSRRDHIFSYISIIKSGQNRETVIKDLIIWNNSCTFP